MKTQNFGRSAVRPGVPASCLVICCTCSETCFSLKNYRESRENGTELDNPMSPFPSGGIDKLDIKSSTLQSGKYPDSQGRYWWKLTLQDGRVNTDCYWMKDETRGWPDKSDKNRYWFTVHHAPTNTKIEGFSQEADYQKGFPDKDKKYWYYIQFTDTHCPAIRQWMEEKDKHYQIRMLIRILYQSPKIEDRFNLFTELPDELQLMIFEFVLGVKLTQNLFKNARDLAVPKEILMKLATPILSKCEENLEVTTNQLSLNDDEEFYFSFKK